MRRSYNAPDWSLMEFAQLLKSYYLIHNFFWVDIICLAFWSVFQKKNIELQVCRMQDVLITSQIHYSKISDIRVLTKDFDKTQYQPQSTSVFLNVLIMFDLVMVLNFYLDTCCHCAHKLCFQEIYLWQNLWYAFTNAHSSDEFIELKRLVHRQKRGGQVKLNSTFRSEYYLFWHVIFKSGSMLNCQKTLYC